MTLHQFPSGGQVPPSEAQREGDSDDGASSCASGDIAAGAHGPLRRSIEQIGLFAVGALFVIGAFAIGVLIVVFGLAVFLAYLTLGILWSVRTVLIGLAFAVVIAKIVGLL